MAEEFLNGPQIGAVVQHIGGERVSQDMRRQPFAFHFRALEILFHCSVDQLVIDRLAVGSDKECFRPGTLLSAHLTVVFYKCRQFRSERHQSVFITLSMHF